MTIAICTYNRMVVFETLNNLLSFDCDILDNFQILIIDNFGLIELETYCEKRRLKYIYESEPGLSFARNRALAITKDEWIYFVDDDVYFTKEILESLTDKFDNNAIIYSAVLPSSPLIINGEFLKGKILSSLSVHSDKIYPIGCSFGFFNNQKYTFNESLGRMGRKLSGSEENDIIVRLTNEDNRVLKELKGAIIHRIENKLNQDYVNQFYYHELKEKPLPKFVSYSVKLFFYTVLRNNKTYRIALAYSLKKFLENFKLLNLSFLIFLI